jgi:hypothetical protein
MNDQCKWQCKLLLYDAITHVGFVVLWFVCVSNLDPIARGESAWRGSSNAAWFGGRVWAVQSYGWSLSVWANGSFIVDIGRGSSTIEEAKPICETSYGLNSKPYLQITRPVNPRLANSTQTPPWSVREKEATTRRDRTRRRGYMSALPARETSP